MKEGNRNRINTYTRRHQKDQKLGAALTYRGYLYRQHYMKKNKSQFFVCKGIKSQTDIYWYTSDGTLPSKQRVLNTETAISIPGN